MSDHLDRLEEELDDAEMTEEEIAAAVGRLPISVSEWADETRAKVLGKMLHAESRRNMLRAERDALDEACDDLRKERDYHKANSESWRAGYNSWADWAKDLLDDLGRQPLHGFHGDGPAREAIAQLAGQAAGVPRCSRCGCFVTRHEVDDEERRECADCECSQFEATE